MREPTKRATIALVKTSPENKALKDAFRKAFVRRTKVLREASGLPPEEIAQYLGVKLDTYYRYESKVAMPHYLIPRFLAITEGDAAYLMGLGKDRRKPSLHSI